MMISFGKFSQAASVFVLVATQGLSSAAKLECPTPVLFEDDAILAVAFPAADKFYEEMITESVIKEGTVLSVVPPYDPMKPVVPGAIRWDSNPEGTEVVCNDKDLYKAPFTCFSDEVNKAKQVLFDDEGNEIEINSPAYQTFVGNNWCTAPRYVSFDKESQSSILDAGTIVAFGMPNGLLKQILPAIRDPSGVRGLKRVHHATPVKGDTLVQPVSISSGWRLMENFIAAATLYLKDNFEARLNFHPTIFVAPLCDSNAITGLQGYTPKGIELGFVVLIPPKVDVNDIIFGHSLNPSVVSYETLNTAHDAAEGLCVLSAVTFVFQPLPIA